MIDKFSFGYTNGIVRDSLSGTFTPAQSGLFLLKVENTRSAAASTCLFNFIDNISLKPETPDFEADRLNVPCKKGAIVNFDLDAGPGFAGSPYWIWMSATGNWPGMTLNGVTVPLNWDLMTQFGLLNPAYAGFTDFLGALDGSGQAKASAILPVDTQLMFTGFPLCFAYVVCTPGPKMPVLYASLPVHVKYVP